MPMRRFLLALIALLALSPAAHAVRPLPQPQLLAVYFYADWCANCKALAPALTAARSAVAQDDILFVTLDLTDKPRIHQSILLAQALGIGDFLRAQGSATGYVAVLDAATKKERIRFDRTNDAASIEQGLKKALAH